MWRLTRPAAHDTRDQQINRLRARQSYDEYVEEVSRRNYRIMVSVIVCVRICVVLRVCVQKACALGVGMLC